jgi:SAM-dependent methyltransferase
MGLADLAGKVDFALAFAMVHEIPSAAAFFSEVAAAMKPGARLLLVEPSGHVNESKFGEELGFAARVGLTLVERLSIRRSRAALLQKA